MIDLGAHNSLRRLLHGHLSSRDIQIKGIEINEPMVSMPFSWSMGMSTPGNQHVVYLRIRSILRVSNGH